MEGTEGTRPRRQGGGVRANPGARVFAEALAHAPVIAAVRNEARLAEAAASCVDAVFLLGGSILTLPGMVAALKGAGKRVFIHMDLPDGLGRDTAAVEWCAAALRVDGLISTKPQLLRRAAQLDLVTVQRLFLMDSSSLSNGVRLLRANPPDMVEVLPGLVPKAVAQLRRALNIPVIAGGMVTERAEVADALAAGAIAVSTSAAKLWENWLGKAGQGERIHV